LILKVLADPFTTGFSALAFCHMLSLPTHSLLDDTVVLGGGSDGEATPCRPSRKGSKSFARQSSKHRELNAERFVSAPTLGAWKDLLTEDERITALSCGHIDQGWLLSEGTETKKRDLLGHLLFSKGLVGRRALFVARGSLCAVLVLVNANDTVIKALSQHSGHQAQGRPYMPSSVMLVSNLLSVITGNLLCVVLSARRKAPNKLQRPLHQALQTFWVCRQLLQMSVPAVLFTLSGTLKFVALGLIHPDMVIAMEQGTVLLCAVMGWLWLKKSYSRGQWAGLLTITAGLAWHQIAKRHELHDHAVTSSGVAEASQLLAGVILMLGSVVTVTGGGLSCEVLLKGSGDRPFYIQKAQMELSMAFAGLFFCLVVQPLLQGSCPLLEHGLLYGWNGWTVLVLLLHTAKSWLATTTVLLLDNLTFTLTGNVSMLLVYMEQLLLLSAEHTSGFQAEVFFALLCTAFGVAGFAAASTLKVNNNLPRNLRRAQRRNSWKTAMKCIPLDDVDETGSITPPKRYGSKESKELGLIRESSNGSSMPSIPNTPTPRTPATPFHHKALWDEPKLHQSKALGEV